MTYLTAFRTTAILPDATGRYRTSIILASRLNGEWSDAAKARQVEMETLPCAALRLTVAEYEALDAAGIDGRTGYVDAAGDVETPFTPEAWSRYA